jgi:hypothetical protein
MFDFFHELGIRAFIGDPSLYVGEGSRLLFSGRLGIVLWDGCHGRYAQIGCGVLVNSGTSLSVSGLLLAVVG